MSTTTWEPKNWYFFSKKFEIEFDLYFDLCRRAEIIQVGLNMHLCVDIGDASSSLWGSTSSSFSPCASKLAFSLLEVNSFSPCASKLAFSSLEVNSLSPCASKLAFSLLEVNSLSPCASKLAFSLLEVNSLSPCASKLAFSLLEVNSLSPCAVLQHLDRS